MNVNEALAIAGIESSIKTLEKYEEFATFSGEQDMQKSAREAIEAFKIILSAVQKQIPKKLELFNGQACCPECEVLFGNSKDLKLLDKPFSYCKCCGQALDFNNNND